MIPQTQRTVTAPPQRAAVTNGGAATAVTRALSPSQLTTWLDCSAKWFYRYLLGLPDPPTSSLAIGRAVHRAAAGALRGKGAGVDVSADEIIVLAHDCLAEELTAAQLGPDETPGDCHRSVEAMTAVWMRAGFPGIDPLAVEADLHADVGGVHVCGVADVIARQPDDPFTGEAQPPILIDLKTSGRRPGKMKSSHRLQLATYGELAGIDVGQIQTITDAHVVMHTANLEEERAFVRAIYPTIAEAMETGLYPPNRTSLLCSQRYCAFWRNCERDHGGCVPE
jgi:RecB family exonuclease